MPLNEADPLVRAAVFGRQTEEFLNSELGRFLVARADEQRDAAVDALKRVAPWRTRRIRQLQNEIAVAESVQQWLADAVTEGQQALQVLEDEHHG